MANHVHGNTDGLNARQMERLERLYSRRVPPDVLVTPEFAHHLTYLADETNRKIAVLVDRRGRVEYVVVGDAHRVYLPDIGRVRGGGARLRGLRMMVTSVTSQGKGLLTRDELTDLAKLRLDAVVSMDVLPGGQTGRLEYAHLLPSDAETTWETQQVDKVQDLTLPFDAFVRELENELQRKAVTTEETGGEPAILVHLDILGVKDSDARMREMEELCRTAGVQIVDVISQRRRRADPRFAVGRGKIEQIELRALELGADLLIFSCDLTPGQVRAITNRTELKVIDRTQLILDIFAQRATTHDGKLQVELAQLKYTLPKLIQKNTALSRLTGGIGGRGPGETKLEVNRRRARDKINRLQKQLDKLSQQRALRRQRRTQRDVPVVSLVGYTNAGKSTLLNVLTNAEVLSEDKLFATLDPTSRRLRFPEDREVILTDTVGFIRDLPKDLVAAFKATLEELDEADVLLHVVDASDPNFENHIIAVDKILGELDLNDKPKLLVFNKCDLLDPEDARHMAQSWQSVPVSALDAESTEPLLQAIDRVLWREGKTEPDSVGESPSGVVVNTLEP